MSRYTDEQDEITFTEPILAQKSVKLKVAFAEKEVWEVKEKKEWNIDQRMTMSNLLGTKYDACKLTLSITDESVRTEHENAKPKLTIEDRFNIEQYPFPDKKTGTLRKMGKQKLYELEAALGFEPVFMVNGQQVEAFITKTGAKVAPKTEGVKRVINPDFFNSYFNVDGTPNMDNWADKIIYADVSLEKSEQYGAKNAIGRYVKAPAI